MENKDFDQLFLDNGFNKLRKSNWYKGDQIDLDKFDYSLQISDVPTYLHYSIIYGYFSLTVYHNPIKGLAGGGKQVSTSIMIPQVARTKEKIQKIINFFKYGE